MANKRDYSVDLKLLNDEKFRKAITAAFQGLDKDKESLGDEFFMSGHDDLEKEIQAILENPNASTTNALNLWMKGGSSFDNIENNLFDVDLKDDPEYGYEWYMGLDSKSIADIGSKSPYISKKYGLTNPETEYQNLIDERYAALSALEGFDNVLSKKPIPYNLSSFGIQTGAGGIAPEVQAVLSDTFGEQATSDKIEVLKKNGYFDDNTKDLFLKQADKRSKSINLNQIDSQVKDRFVDSEEELRLYHSLKLISQGSK